MFLVTSPMYLSGRYAFCQGFMMLSKMGFNLLVRTPDAIFRRLIIGGWVLGCQCILGLCLFLGINITSPFFLSGREGVVLKTVIDGKGY